MVDVLSEEEKSERLFSQLTAAWYNWAVFEMLYEKNVSCWALTAAYYSMFHAARTLMNLTPYPDEKFVRNHTPFLNFLSGEKHIEERAQAIEILSKALGITANQVDETFMRLNKVLSAFKDTREMASYERYVIAHQFRTDIQASSWIDDLSKRAFVYVAEINTKTSDLILEYLKLSPSSAYHLCHLKQEIEQFHSLLRKENLPTPKGAEIILKRFEDLIASTSKPKDMSDFIQNTMMYSSKNLSYEQLHSTLLKVRGLD